MTVTLSVWFLPIGATLLVWLAAAFYRAGSRHSGGDYGFGAFFDALARLILGGVSTLLIWLIFFAAMWWYA